MGAFRQFALEHERTLTRQVQDQGIPFSIHICGDTTDILEDMASTGARVLELDWQVDMARAAEIVGGKATLMGNINPSDPLVSGSPSDIDMKAREVIRKTRGRNLILSSGCAMGSNTRPENRTALVEAAKRYGTKAQILEMKADNGGK